jgi:hypothetical protein
MVVLVTDLIQNLSNKAKGLFACHELNVGHLVLVTDTICTRGNTDKLRPKGSSDELCWVVLGVRLCSKCVQQRCNSL